AASIPSRCSTWKTASPSPADQQPRDAPVRRAEYLSWHTLHGCPIFTQQSHHKIVAADAITQKRSAFAAFHLKANLEITLHRTFIESVQSKRDAPQVEFGESILHRQPHGI